MKFVVFHGSFGGPESHWFPQLKEKLEALGQKVVAPQFPVDDWEELTKAGPNRIPKNQNLDNWFKVFDKMRQEFKKGEKLCFVGHSLGPLFILHLVEKYNLQLDSAIFVAPFLRKLNRSWQIDLVNQSFYRTDFDFEKLKKLIPVSYVLYSDDDPYVGKEYSLEFAEKLGSLKTLIKGGKHLNDEAGFTNLPLVFELCRARLNSL